MSAPTKLFLEWNDIDGQYHVIDKEGHAFGGGSYEPTEAIKHARMVSDAPISFGDSYAGFERHCVHERPEHALTDHELFIQALAEIGGMKVTKLFDDEMDFMGWVMEAER
jgi:hypothetical protein